MDVVAPVLRHWLCLYILKYYIYCKNRSHSTTAILWRIEKIKLHENRRKFLKRQCQIYITHNLNGQQSRVLLTFSGLKSPDEGSSLQTETNTGLLCYTITLHQKYNSPANSTWSVLWKECLVGKCLPFLFVSNNKMFEITLQTNIFA